MTLKVSRDIELPDDAITQTFGILAVRGAGKTNTAVVMAEEMYDRRLPFVVVDPVGVWWGLRSAADGKKPGLAIPVLGGRHGDIPLEKSGGELVADFIVRERVSCVLDVSEFTEGDKKRFLLAFAQRLYRKNTEPLHLFLEEADDYVPQKPMREEAHLLRSFENIVRRGRARGLGITMVTQRSAAINKNVLTQIETLIVLRTTSPQDRKAIEGWVEYHAESKDMLQGLSALPNGTAWLWSPSWLRSFSKVRIRRRSTFDSAATPTTKGRRAANLADVDLSTLEAQFKETIEAAKESDPRELTRRVRELERELASQKSSGSQQTVKEVEVPVEKLVEVKVPVITDRELARLERIDGWLTEIRTQVDELTQLVRVRITEAEETVKELRGRNLSRQVMAPTRPASGNVRQQVSTAMPKVVEGGLTEYAKHLLQTFAERHPMPLSKVQLSTMSGRSKKSSMFSPAFRELEVGGYIAPATVPGGKYTLAERGRQGMADFIVNVVPKSPEALQEMWLSKLPAYEADLLRGVRDLGDADVDRLAEHTGRSRTSSMFSPALRNLVSLGLVVKVAGQYRLSEDLEA